MRSVITRWAIGVTSSLAIAAGIGCQGQYAASQSSDGFVEDAQEAEMNELMVRSIFSESQRNAIIAEHTIYPHHFRMNTKHLNDLGERQVEVLAMAYREGPGPVTIVRGDAADELYESRIQTVMDRFTTHGVDSSMLVVNEDLPPGATITSDRAVEILRPEDDGGRRRSRSGGNSGGGMQTQPREDSNYE